MACALCRLGKRRRRALHTAARLAAAAAAPLARLPSALPSLLLALCLIRSHKPRLQRAVWQMCSWPAPWAAALPRPLAFRRRQCRAPSVTPTCCSPLLPACRMADDFYVRYYVGHKGKFGHGETAGPGLAGWLGGLWRWGGTLLRTALPLQDVDCRFPLSCCAAEFLEFEFRPDGKVSRRYCWATAKQLHALQQPGGKGMAVPAPSLRASVCGMQPSACGRSCAAPATPAAKTASSRCLPAHSPRCVLCLPATSLNRCSCATPTTP